MTSSALTIQLQKQREDERLWWSQVVSGVCQRDKCTRAQLAEALKVSAQTLWYWRQGLSQPSLEHWVRVRALASGKIRVQSRSLVAA